MAHRERSPDRPAPLAVARRNYRFGVINGVSFTIGESITSPGLVLSLLVRQLGGPLTLIGMLPAIQTMGYLMPQLLVSGRLQALRFRLPFYRRIGLVRLGVQALLVAAIFGAAVLPPPIALALIVGLYTLFNFAGGMTTLAFQDVVAKVIPLTSRGRFFGTRQLVGGLLAFALGGTLVRWLLSADSPVGFPGNFGTLAFLSLVCFSIGIGSFSLVKEPPQPVPARPQRAIDGLRRAPELLRTNRNYRWFIITRLLGRTGQIAEPFYIIYATETLGLPQSVAGIFVATWALAGALSNLGWGRLSDRHGNRALLLLTSSIAVLGPLLMLAGPAAVHAAGLGETALVATLALAFLAVGAAADGNMIASMTYLLEVAPEDERPTYVGLANTILGVGALLPVLGGWLVLQIGYQGTFLAGACFALLALASSRRLVEVRRQPATRQRTA